MTNFEKYKDDLMKIVGTFAFDKTQRKIVGCRDSANEIEECIDCEDCLFNDTQYCFESDKIKWLYKEYKEPIISNDEIELINILSKINGKEYKYIHKRSKYIFIFSDKPNIDKYGIISDGSNYIEIKGHIDLFSNIKFEHGLYDIKNKCFIEI